MGIFFQQGGVVVRVDSNSHRSKQISFFFSRFFCFLSFCFFCFFSRFLFFFFANMTMRTDCPTHTIHRQPTNAAETATKKSKNYHCKLYFDIPVKDDTKKVEVCLFVCLFVLKVFFCSLSHFFSQAQEQTNSEAR